MPPSRILLSLGEHVSEGMARQLEELARVLDAYGADKYGGLAQMIDDFRAGKPGAEEKLTVYLEDLRDEASTLQLESPGSHAMARDFEQAGMGAGGEFQDAQTRDFLQNEMGMQYEDTGKLIDDPLEAADEGMDPFPARRNDFGQESFEEPDFGGFGDPSPAVSGGIRTREPSAYTQAYDDILAGRTPNWAAVENAPGARTLRDLYFLVKEDPEIARHLKEGAEPGAVSGETGGFYPTPNRGRGAVADHRRHRNAGRVAGTQENRQGEIPGTHRRGSLPRKERGRSRVSGSGSRNAEDLRQAWISSEYEVPGASGGNASPGCP